MHFNVGNSSYKLGDLNKAREHTEKAKEMMNLMYEGSQTINTEHLAKVR